MSIGRRVLVFSSIAMAASACWDGALDPLISLRSNDGGVADVDGDSDSDSDSDTDSVTDGDTGTEVDTTPEDCTISVNVTVYFDFWHVDQCPFDYHGSCLPDPNACDGCAWTVDGVCAGSQVCCVPKEILPSCETDWGDDVFCGYLNDTDCDGTGGNDIDPPSCQGGSFCCFTYA